MSILLLIFFSILPLVSLLPQGLPLTHDGQDHVARIANFYLSLSEGNLIPRWAGNLNWGYGHPILMFLYPLPSYVASFFHWFGFSFVDSTKWVFAAAFIASILAMYLWLSRAVDKTAGFVGAVLYGFAPYRFVDLSVRGAIGEHIAFVFPPLICWGLLSLAQKEKKTIAVFTVSLGSAGLLLAHNALSLMFIPLILFYIAYLYFFDAKKQLKFLLLTAYCLLLGILLSAFFWAPAFFEGKYTLRDIVTKGEFTDRFVPWMRFFTSGGNEFSKEIGLLHWMGIVGSVIVLFKSKVRKLRIGILVLLIIFLTSLFLMTEASQLVWNNITILQKFQFPWRFLSVSVFASSVLGAIGIAHVKNKLMLVAYCLLLIVLSFPMWQPKNYLIKPESFFTSVYAGTTDTGESSPIWSVRFMERQAAAPYQVIEGKGAIEPIDRKSTGHTFAVNAKTRTRIVDNTLYFPGWQVFVDGKPAEIEFQDPSYRGLMTFWVDEGTRMIDVRFGETKLRKAANFISIAGLLLLLATVTIRGATLWRKSR